MKASKHNKLFKLKSAIVADMWVMRCANKEQRNQQLYYAILCKL